MSKLVVVIQCDIVTKRCPRVTKYIESGKAYFPRVCKDIQELA